MRPKIIIILLSMATITIALLLGINWIGFDMAKTCIVLLVLLVIVCIYYSIRLKNLSN